MKIRTKYAIPLLAFLVCFSPPAHSTKNDDVPRVLQSISTSLMFGSPRHVYGTFGFIFGKHIKGDPVKFGGTTSEGPLLEASLGERDYGGSLGICRRQTGFGLIGSFACKLTYLKIKKDYFSESFLKGENLLGMEVDFSFILIGLNIGIFRSLEQPHWTPEASIGFRF